MSGSDWTKELLIPRIPSICSMESVPYGVSHSWKLQWANSYRCYYAEVKFTAKGQTGHGSLLHENTAAEKIHVIINKMLSIRESEKKRFKENNLELGDVTTINMTMLSVSPIE